MIRAQKTDAILFIHPREIESDLIVQFCFLDVRSNSVTANVNAWVTFVRIPFMSYEIQSNVRVVNISHRVSFTF